MNDIQNILATRYATKPIKDIWNETGKVKAEREFWMAVMKAQKELGIQIPDEAIESYEKHIDDIDLDSIREREKVLRHDVKAKIEEFCNLAGFEHIHKGLTSRDLTDNVEQFQVLNSLKYIHKKAISALKLLNEKSLLYKDILISARTHNVAAQPTTLGKRLSMFGEELIFAVKECQNLIEQYPLRGIKGACGTLLDINTLFKNDQSKTIQFQEKIAQHLGFNKILNSVGQVYPRSLDFTMLTVLNQLASAPSSFCKTMRIMAGHELMSEGFQKGQVGSSAMPHKMNSRNCERVCGFHTILKGYLTMASSLNGDQWNEGDVSCSVVRRVMLPDAFFAIDGLLETFLVILTEMTVFEPMIEKETEKYLPFLISTTLLMEAVKKGGNREICHEIIKQYAVQAIDDLRNNRTDKNSLFEKLDQDNQFPLSLNDIDEIMNQKEKTTGLAHLQINQFNKEVQSLIEQFPESKSIQPGMIL